MLSEPATLSVDGLNVAQVLTPRDPESVAQALCDADAAGRAVVPRGGGTMLDLGEPLARADIVLSLDKLDRILDHQPANLTVQLQPGMTLAALNGALAASGQYLPLDPPHAERATLGGILAANASGPLRVRFGSARDQLLGIRVALADGKIVRGGGQVVKNVAGYDLPKLLIGSLGTLGVIVEATFKTAPLPKTTATLVANLDSLVPAAALAARILQSPLLPLSVEVISPAVSTALGLGTRAALLARFGGNASAVGRQLNDVASWAREAGGTGAVVEQDAELWTRIADWPLDHETVLKAGVPPTQIGALAARAEELAREHDIAAGVLAHSVGIVFVAFQGEPGRVEAATQGLRATAGEHGGYLIVQRGSRELRERVGAWGPMRSDFAVMQRLKAEFDPHAILNPGRFGAF